ncbi:MAG: AarF/ABC1/UbiB kinase family protein [Proteobacteria bacterium]|nr:AarF/ABC1/UbiB kinase family protein [Pseudomonadota bacterium]
MPSREAEREEDMAVKVDLEKRNLLRAAPRLIQILRVLAKHKILSALRGKGHWPAPKEVRETFEELGLTFLKFGQVLALRRDLLPDAYIEELELLHDQLPAMSIGAVRATIEAELGAPLAVLFTSFCEIPLAAATIAQVHDAIMPDGRHVAVKVQRPDLETMISTDISALTNLVALLESIFPRLHALDLPVLVREFANSLSRETDFQREARSIVLFRTALADVPDLWIPDVVPERSSGNVLTMEFSDGERVDLYAKKHPEAISRSIKTLVRLMLQTIFEEGLFHSDPHPGNVFVLPDGRLSLLDFGMTGELDESMRESLKLLLEAVVKGDALAARDAYLEMSPGSENVKGAALLMDIKAVLHEIHRSDLAEVSIGDTLETLLRAGSRHGVHNPSEFFLLTRAFVILEAMIRQLDPQHNYMESFREQVSRLTEQHFSLDRIKDKTGKLAREVERLVMEAPGDTRRILRRIAEGNIGRVQAPSLEALGGRVCFNLERLQNVIISAALMVSGALLVVAPLDSGWHHEIGQLMVTAGFFGTVYILIKGLRSHPGRR